MSLSGVDGGCSASMRSISSAVASAAITSSTPTTLDPVRASGHSMSGDVARSNLRITILPPESCGCAVSGVCDDQVARPYLAQNEPGRPCEARQHHPVGAGALDLVQLRQRVVPHAQLLADGRVVSHAT